VIRREAELSKAAAEIGHDVTPIRADTSNLADIDHEIKPSPAAL
jgi:hypothetical protein